MPVIDLKKQERTVNLEVNKRIRNEEVQTKCYIAELIKTALNNYLDFDDLRADSTYSAYRLPIINEDTDVIDFEINSLSVHVIPTIDKAKNANVYIPKSYRTFTCKPDMIIFVNFTKGLTKMDILGFITNIDLSSLAINKSMLSDADDLIDVLKSLRPKHQHASENAINAAKELMLSYIESSLSEEGRQFFIKHLLAHKEIRKNYKLFYALNCDFIAIANEHKMLSEAGASSKKIAKIYEEPKDEIQPDVSAQIFEEPATDEELNIQSDTFEDETAQKDDIFSENADTAENIVEINEEFENIVDTTIIPEVTDVAGEDSNHDILDNKTSGLDIMDSSALNSSDNTEYMQSEINTAEEKNNTETELDFSPIDTDDEESFELEDMDDFSLEDSGEDITLEEADETETEQPNTGLTSNRMQVKPQTTAEEETPFAGALVPDEAGAEAVEEKPVISLQESEPPQEVQTENSETSGDDIFSFLSEMADETQEEAQQPESTMPPEVNNEETSYTPAAQEEIVQEPVQEEPQAPAEEIPVSNIVGMGSMNNAFSPQGTVQNNQQTIPQQEQQPQQIAYEQPKKSSAMPLLAAATVLALLGVGIWLNKDKIPFINQGDTETEVQELAKDNVKDALPAPIDDSKLPSAVNTDNPQGETAPPPAPTANAGVPAPSGVSDKPAQQQKTADAQKSDEAIPKLPASVEPPKPKHLNDAIANALTKDFSGVRISKVSWEVSETLINNPEVKRYLTIAGKSVKNALSQDLMAATEPSMKENVIVDIIYKKDGTVSNVKIASSSGSSQIDEIVTKSVKETLKYIKMPSLNINKPEYTAKLIVRL